MMMPPSRGQMCNSVYQWWLADAPEGFTKTLPDHQNCHHRDFRLTCVQYEGLLARSGNRCEICRLHAAGNARGKLHIDHDPELGIWAVRGLVCRYCNSTLRFPSMTETVQPYLFNSWYLGAIAATGVPVTGRPEPVLGAYVYDHARRAWHHEPSGWMPNFATPQSWGPRTWAEMNFQFGPHNLVEGGAP